MMKLLSLPLAFFLFSGNALGQSSGWSLAAAGVYGTDYDGSMGFNIFPIIQYDTGPWTFGGKGLVSYAWGNPDQGLRGEGGFGFDIGQNQDGAPELGFAPTLTASATYRFPYFEISAGLERRIGSGAGNLITLDLASGYPVSDTTFLGVRLDMEWADADRRQAFYGLNSSGAVGTGLSVVSINALGDRQSYILGISYIALNNDISALPFVNTPSLTKFIFSYSYDI